MNAKNIVLGICLVGQGWDSLLMKIFCLNIEKLYTGGVMTTIDAWFLKFILMTK